MGKWEREPLSLFPSLICMRLVCPHLLQSQIGHWSWYYWGFSTNPTRVWVKLTFPVTCWKLCDHSQTGISLFYVAEVCLQDFPWLNQETLLLSNNLMLINLVSWIISWSSQDAFPVTMEAIDQKIINSKFLLEETNRGKRDVWSPLQYQNKLGGRIDLWVLTT